MCTSITFSCKSQFLFFSHTTSLTVSYMKLSDQCVLILSCALKIMVPPVGQEDL